MEAKHFFASANTGIGFVKKFDNINTDEDGFEYIIKGGSGTGKSSLMRKVGEHFLKKGFNIEFIHCSTDTKSLDGVRICDFNITILDGTAPHVTEADVPGVLNKLIDVGQFIKEDINIFKNDILSILEEKKKYFSYLYLYLESAYKLLNITKTFKSVDQKKVEIETDKVLKLLNLERLDRKPTERNLFFSAISKNGKLDLTNCNNFKNIQTIKGDICFCDSVLKSIKQKVKEKGFDVIGLLNFLDPTLLEAVFIPANDTLIMALVEEPKNEILKFNEKQIEVLLKQAGHMIEEAKKLHSKLEEFYVSHMHFKDLDKLTKRLIDEIEKKIKLKKLKNIKK